MNRKEALSSCAIWRIGSARWRPGGSVKAISLSPAGDRLVSMADRVPGLGLWNVATGVLVQSFPTSELCKAVCFSGDGSYVIGAGTSAYCFRVQDGDATKTEPRPRTLGACLAGAPDATCFVVGYQDGYLVAYDIPRCEVVSKVRAGVGRITSLGFHPTGRLFAVTGKEGRISLREWPSFREVGVWEDVTTDEKVLAFSPDGKRLASAEWNGTVRVWDIDQGKSVVVGREDGPIDNLAYAAGGIFVTCLGPPSLSFWTARESGQRELLDDGSLGHINCVTTDGSGKLVASGHVDCTVKLWNGMTAGEITVRDAGEPSGIVHWAGFCQDASCIAGASGRAVQIWNVKRRRLINSMDVRARIAGGASCLKGDLCALGCWNGEVAAVDTRRGELMFCTDAHRESVDSVAVSRNGQQIASAERDIRFWSVTGERRPHRIEPGAVVHSLAWTAGDTVVAAGMSGSFRVFEAESGRCLLSRESDVVGWTRVCTSTDQRLCAAFMGRRLCVWSSDDWKLLTDVETIDGIIDACCFVGAHTIAMSSGDRIMFFDAISGRKIGELSGHLGTVISLASDPDGRLLVSAGADATIVVWDAAKILAEHTADVQ